MKSREAFSGRSFGHVTRDPIVKRSGGKSPNQRVLFVRSTFDWAVCSEPLACLRRTRDYGDSIFAERFGFVTSGGSGMKG